MKSDVSRLRHTRAFSAGGLIVRRALNQGSDGSVRREGSLTPPADAAGPTSGVPSTQIPATSAAPTSATPPDLRTAVDVVLVGYPRENMWVLPKGTPALGETPQQTAVREVREETGLDVHIVREIGSIFYAFTRRGVRFDKEVKHYLMVAVGGDVSLHDHEYDESRWFPLAEALRRLRHKNESDVLLRAEPLIAQWLQQTDAHGFGNLSVHSSIGGGTSTGEGPSEG